MSPEQLRARAAAWRDADPDPATRAEVDDLLARDDLAALTERFDGRLAFGTAGLRGPLGAGPRRMNRLTVRQTTAGLCTWLPHGAAVVVGFDARHGSRAFADDVAGVVAAAGGRALLLDAPLPTPVLAFAVRHLGADAGVMITASHNPAGDNGYKLYLADGAQLRPPLDEEIAAAIAAAPLAPRVVAIGDAGSAVVRCGTSVRDAYVEAVADELSFAPVVRAPLRLVHTSLHGVAGAVLPRLFADVGLPAPAEVADQAEPDPDFPTLAFPNPEEPGALDHALALAAGTDADLVLANDPDADRLGVAVPDGTGGWLALTGDEIGALLGDWVLRHTHGPDRLVATTVVSGTALGRIAAAHGVRHAVTLTGFKWIVRPGLDDPTARFVFGYEEALGFAFGDAVRDKDGLAAAVAMTRLAIEERAAGSTILRRLASLAAQHGLEVTTLRSLRFDADPLRPAAIMAALRATPPTEIAGSAVVGLDDLADPGGPLPPTDAIVLRLDSGVRLTLRPSGTEPKLKCYLGLVEPLAGREWVAARLAGRARLEALGAELAARLSGGGAGAG